MTKISRGRLAAAASIATAGGLVVALAAAPPAWSARSAAVHRHQSQACHAAQLAGSGGFLGKFKQVCTIASTVPGAGDVNPYGVAVVPATTGSLVAGDILVS